MDKRIKVISMVMGIWPLEGARMILATPIHIVEWIIILATSTVMVMTAVMAIR